MTCGAAIAALMTVVSNNPFDVTFGTPNVTFDHTKYQKAPVSMNDDGDILAIDLNPQDCVTINITLPTGSGGGEQFVFRDFPLIVLKTKLGDVATWLSSDPDFTAAGAGSMQTFTFEWTKLAGHKHRRYRLDFVDEIVNGNTVT